MHIKVVRFCALVLAIALVSFCQKQDKAKDTIATIDGAKITKDAYNSFWEMRRLYPTYTGDFFPGERSLATYLVHTILASDDGKAKSYAGKLKSSPGWEWRERYFPAQMYLQKVLDANLGFSDKDLEAYYKAHLSTYKTKIQVEVPVPGAAAAKAKDTSKAKIATPPQTVKKDSVVVRTFPEVKEQVMRSMFLAKYPVPDSMFKKHDPKDTAKVDTSEVQNRWMYMVRSDLPSFFMRKSYEEKYKQKFPDSLKDWYGKGKPITEGDMDVIMSWLPETQRAMYNTSAGKADLARWLLKWKLFSEDAKRTGFSSQDNVKSVIDWAWKVEVATNYVNSELVPKAKTGVSIDTEMCVYGMWDDRGSAATRDTASVNRTVTKYLTKAVYIKVDSMLYGLRKAHNIVFLLPEYKDEQAGNPVAMAAHADSMRDTGNTTEAASVYRTLVTSFPFTPEGQKAYAELAKVQSEKGEYTDAVKNYRDYLVLVNDKSKRCNTFFMIGFIYDEYLNKSDLAEVNYKWVLKNTPECELANDAEFMTLHLGEPMNSVEELRAEARRQGRKVDTSTPAPEIMNPDTGSKVKAKKI
jgi:tetratricopeptide (TPR) repeat protein